MIVPPKKVYLLEELTETEIRPRRSRQPQGGRIFCGSLFCRPHFGRNGSSRSHYARAARTLALGHSRRSSLLGRLLPPCALSHAEGLACLGHDRTLATPLYALRMCAADPLIAHQQPCLPPAHLHGGTTFCSDAFLPIGCSDAACMLLRFVPCRLSGSVSTRPIVGSRSGPHTSTYPPHCPQLLIKLPAVWTKRDN